jgi:hypothetical protein
MIETGVEVVAVLDGRSKPSNIDAVLLHIGHLTTVSSVLP